jgi:ATP-dependent DNA ligase
MQPIIPVPRKEPFEWLFELKLDGFRLAEMLRYGGTHRN